MSRSDSVHFHILNHNYQIYITLNSLPTKSWSESLVMLWTTNIWERGCYCDQFHHFIILDKIFSSIRKTIITKRIVKLVKNCRSRYIMILFEGCINHALQVWRACKTEIILACIFSLILTDKKYNGKFFNNIVLIYLSLRHLLLVDHWWPRRCTKYMYGTYLQAVFYNEKCCFFFRNFLTESWNDFS